MPYKREIARKSKSVISENLRDYLLTGELAKGDVEVFVVSGNKQKLKMVWQAVEGEILRDWIKNSPCTRPFAFWIFAPEKRKKVSGSGGWRMGMALDAEGLPGYWAIDWNEKNPPSFESQARYLVRNGLLTAMEMKYLEKNTELLEPERVEKA